MTHVRYILTILSAVNLDERRTVGKPLPGCVLAPTKTDSCTIGVDVLVSGIPVDQDYVIDRRQNHTLKILT